MAGMLDLFGGGNLGGDNFMAGGQPSFADILAQNRNALVGLGLGIAGGERNDGGALRGYMAGSGMDQRAMQQAQAMRRAQQVQAHQAQRDRIGDSQWERSFAQKQHQFNESRKLKPTIQYKPAEEDEYGNKKGEGQFWLLDPEGQSARPLTKQQVQSLGPAVQSGQIGMSEAPDETAIPVAAAPAQAAAAQPIPDNVNKKEYVKKYSGERGEQDAKAVDRSNAGGRVLSLIDQLDEKTKDPKFAASAGPMQDYASRQPMWNPARLAYEYTPLGPSRENQGFLGQIKSDAQAINTELQRAYLSGQGQVTENEREQISQIMGNISAARSPQEAQAQLKNLRAIISTAFQRGHVVPGQSGQPSSEGRDAIGQELRRRGIKLPDGPMPYNPDAL